VESILVGLVSVLLTIAAGLVGAWINEKREHRKWLREKRFSAFVGLVSEFDKWDSGFDQDAALARELGAHIQILGPNIPSYVQFLRTANALKEAREKAEAAGLTRAEARKGPEVEPTWNEFNDARATFVGDIRKALNI